MYVCPDEYLSSGLHVTPSSPKTIIILTTTPITTTMSTTVWYHF